ncbi:DNA ligase [Vibrio tubiashii]|uniref:DNA ligase n=1 Tax=Vibrio tubiashii TaxID=29498 RepID=UPI00234E6DDA|nr:DNA ligase [Vibrio tubiashii]WCP65767.1 DNA ligase [Vibrio tubiashii]
MNIRLSIVAISVMSAMVGTAQAREVATEFLPVTLAASYEANIDVSDYWKSEKLDGIRAIWNGNTLITRNGNPISAPHWFIEALPDYPLEGELWAGRGNFHLVQQTVLDKVPSDAGWKKIKFMLFDVPHSAGDYKKRYFNLVHLVNSLERDHIRYIEHTPIEDEQELFSYLDSVDSSKGEGLMLRKICSRYQAGRSSDLLKLKKHQDAEALVIGYKVGNGKYKGQMGALLVQLESGEQFYIGSGFSDVQRMNPPEIGSKITFRYNGYTSSGLPRFARYMRERPE